ncbi:MAG: bis(5'-nucleosyl)-tetraphosphatase (symmetrical) YqeK [Lachnospiraceae bacterium]|nr:bis(5'-nucleosyl)-tetraphosphatase (symmetrical) YqeK [Lachnospiraceae bacterium]
MSNSAEKRKEFEHEITQLSKCIKKELDDKRYLHTVSVAYTAGCMAMRYGCDPYKAYLAGLLHDNAKSIPHEKKTALCAKYGLKVSVLEHNNPDLLHASLGSVLARNKYDIHDEEIISAIKYHTTGRPDMTLLEKIIYIADYIEIHRKPLANMEKIRQLAFSDLDACMLLILESTISYLAERKASIDEITLETYEFYKEKVSGKR